MKKLSVIFFLLVISCCFLFAKNTTKVDFVKIKGNADIKDFYISSIEVTQKLYEEVMGENPSYFRGSYLPVEQVSWFDALVFCNKLSELCGFEKCYQEVYYEDKKEWIWQCDFTKNGYRLPSKAEWQRAARVGKDSLGDVAWYWNNSKNRTHLVGEKKPNELGLHDMQGNVAEWVFDSADSGKRIYLGGSWYDKEWYCQVSSAYACSGDSTIYNLGFRLARTSD